MGDKKTPPPPPSSQIRPPAASGKPGSGPVMIVNNDPRPHVTRDGAPKPRNGK